MNRRKFLAASIAGAAITAGASGTSARLDIPDPRIGALNTGDVNLFGISPNGSVLVGKRDTNAICFLDADTRFVTAESEGREEFAMINIRTIAWNPGGTKLAFSLDAWSRMLDSDIFVADVATGEITHLTYESDRKVGKSLLDEKDARIDVSPVWLDDDTVLFARHTNPTGDEFICELWTISPEDGTEALYMDLTEHNIRDVYSKIWLLSGGELVFAAVITGENFQNGVVMITAEGEVTVPHREITRTSQLLSVNDSHMIVQDMQAYEWWYLPLDDSLEPVLLWEQFELPEGWENRAFPILGPEPGTMFTVLRSPYEANSAQLFTPDGNKQLAELTGDFGSQDFHWSEDHILIAGKADSWLVPLEGING